MTRPLRAFVSYRRDDSFMRSGETGATDAGFVDRLKAALADLGFADVFIDTADIKAGDHFEGRIHRAIANCDVFIPLIGRDWLQLLAARVASGERDVLSREIAAAFRLERDVVPLLIDGAAMPKSHELPAEIAPLADIDGKAISSDASAQGLAGALRASAVEASRVHRLGKGWTIGYTVAAFALWVLCGIVPNVVGVDEFGYDAWLGMAMGWSGLFIWPLFFLPFIMLALYRPFQTLVEATLNADTLRDALSYASPVLIGAVIAALGALVDIGPPQVPWSIHPQLLPTCVGGPADPGPSDPVLLRQYEEDKRTLASYGAPGVLPESYDRKFWMRDKCWPDVFYYMTLPYKGVVSSSAYYDERPVIQDAFLRTQGINSGTGLKGTDAPYSRVFPFYAVSLFVMFWALLTAILMSIIYATISIRRPRDGRILRVPTEDAFLCLTYAFVTLIVWVPFRMTTNGVKLSYYCIDQSSSCGPVWDMFAKDAAFGLVLLIGYAALTVGILWNHRRLLLGFIGTVAVALLALAAVAVVQYRGVMSQLTDSWQFWVTVSILISLLLIALWYQYDPAIVRRRDFQASLKRRVT